MSRALFTAVLVLALAAPLAGAATRNQIIRDCADGSLDGKYSASELRDARKNLPADVDEYTDCRDLLTRAAHTGGGAGDGSGSGGSGSAGAGGGGPLTPQSPDEQQALDVARSAGGAGVEIDGETVVPGAAGFAAEAARRDLPLPLVILLALLAAAAVAGAVPQIRRRVLARRPA